MPSLNRSIHPLAMMALLMVVATPLLLSCASGTPPGIARLGDDVQNKRTVMLHSIHSDLDLRDLSSKERYFGPKSSFELKSPSDVVVDKRGSIYISDTGLGGVAASIVTAREGKKTTYSFKLLKTDEFGKGRPEGLGYSAELDWFAVADSYLKEVIIYELPAMRRVGSIKSPELMNPVDVAIDAINKRIYVADSVRDAVLAFDLEGNHIMEIGRPGRDKGGLFRPSSVAVDSGGLVYVVDSFNFRYQVFTSGGQQVFESGEHGKGAGKFSKPHGIAIDPSGTVMVSDFSAAVVQAFPGEGAAPTLLISGLSSASGIYANGNGLLYVSDPYAHRVLIFKLGSRGRN